MTKTGGSERLGSRTKRFWSNIPWMSERRTMALRGDSIMCMSGRAALAYLDMRFSSNQALSVFGIKCASSVPSTWAVTRQDLSRTESTGVGSFGRALRWAGVGVMAVVALCHEGGRLQYGKRQRAKDGTRGYLSGEVSGEDAGTGVGSDRRDCLIRESSTRWRAGRR